MSTFEVVSNVETAIIPKGTVINGNIEINGRLEMQGVVNGDINSNDRVNICGDVKGNIIANEFFSRDSFIEGKIDCKHGAVVRENTVILGDVNAETLNVDGAIQGTLDVKGCLTVGDTAIIDSDIKAKSIQVSNGAAINGKCSLCYADVDLNDLFPKEEKIKVVENTSKSKTRKSAS